MPEEYFNSGNYVFYFPNDSSFCSKTPAYITVLKDYDPYGLGWEEDNTFYKLGIGRTEYDFANGDPTYETDKLLYFSINSVSCGTPLSVNNLSKPNNTIELFPNPANDELTIKTTSTMPYNITIFDVLGQVVYSLYTTRQEETINVSNMPAGVYNVSITDDEGSRANNKVVVLH